MSKYANVLSKAVINLGNDEKAKAEKIFVKGTNQKEIRFSWWTQNGTQFQRTPLDLPEEDWLRLLDEAVKTGVLSQDFIKRLLRILANGLK